MVHSVSGLRSGRVIRPEGLTYVYSADAFEGLVPIEAELALAGRRTYETAEELLKKIMAGGASESRLRAKSGTKEERVSAGSVASIRPRCQAQSPHWANARTLEYRGALSLVTAGDECLRYGVSHRSCRGELAHRRAPKLA